MSPGATRPGCRSSDDPRTDSFSWSLSQDQPWYEDVTNKSRDLLCLHDLEGRLISVNPAAASSLGYSVGELLRIPMRELVSPEFRSQFDEYLQSIAHEGEAHGLLAVMMRSGERRIWEFNNTLRTKGVSAPVVCGVAYDITDQKRMEQQLRESEERYRSVIAAIAEGVVVVDARGRLVASNQSAERIVGVKPEKLAGLMTTMKDWESHTIREDGSPFPAEEYPAAVTLRTGEPQTNVCMGLQRADGEVRWIQANSQPLYRGGEERAYAAVVSFADITERKHAEEALRRSEAELRATQRVAHMGNWRVDVASGAITWSEDIYRMVGLDSAQPAPSFAELRQFLTSQGWIQVMEAYRAGLETEAKPEIEVEFCRADGTIGWAMLRGDVERDPSGKAIAFYGGAMDITGRKLAEQALRESEERRRLAQEVARMGTFEVDLRAGVNRWTPEMEEIYGLPPGGYAKTPDAFLDLVHSEDRHQVERCIEESIRTGEGSGEWRVIHPDGSVHWIAGRWRVFRDQEGRPIRAIGIDYDITERKRTDQALRASEAELREAQRVGRMGSWYRNLKTDEVTWSDQLYRILGLEPGTRVWPVTQMEKFFTPESWQRLERTTETLITTGKADELEVEIRRQDGITGWVLLHREVDRDEAGNIIGVRGIALDITELRETTEALRKAKEKLSEEKLYLEQEINTELGFEEIIGKSVALREVIEQVGKVASSDATVLLLGETGTGKELVARALHRLSHRAGSSFIKMNCAAIPSGLLESELFGHEKGAFTGAVARKLGRLELADNGTLFLDEIGEIPLALQPKLLRVLQDMEFERLGGTKTLRVNFRLIAATNRDLVESVRENEFRSDLYYRLNVFPIRIPPWRERRDDICLLVEHFVQKFAKKMNKAITSIPKATVDRLMEWDWPGNVRELENFIERSVILTHGSVLAAPLSELDPTGQISVNETLETVERDHILQALRESHGRIGGPDGAAECLGLKRTTLQSKLKQMGVDPSEMRD